MIYLKVGKLPWHRLQGGKTQQERYNAIVQKKTDTTLEDLVTDDMPSESSSFYVYCRTLGFDEDPDYGYLHRLLRGLICIESFNHAIEFQWLVKDQGKLIEVQKSLEAIKLAKEEEDSSDNLSPVQKESSRGRIKNEQPTHDWEELIEANPFNVARRHKRFDPKYGLMQQNMIKHKNYLQQQQLEVRPENYNRQRKYSIMQQDQNELQQVCMNRGSLIELVPCKIKSYIKKFPQIAKEHNSGDNQDNLLQLPSPMYNPNDDLRRTKSKASAEDFLDQGIPEQLALSLQRHGINRVNLAVSSNNSQNKTNSQRIKKELKSSNASGTSTELQETSF